MSVQVPLTVVSWLWSQAGGRATYTDREVGIWASMISRNLAMPHRLVCFTDMKNITKDVERIPLPEVPRVRSPHWPPRRPQCYRRVTAFDPAMADVLGPRFVSIDLDVVVTGCLDPLFDRDEDMVFNAGLSSKNCYNGSMWLHRTGTRPQVFSEFTPARAIEASSTYLGSDQAWFRYILGPDEPKWTSKDGVYQWLWLHRKSYIRTLPNDTRIVFFAGGQKPWDRNVEKAYRWIPAHYR